MNRERADYIRALYRHELEDTERFDLVINSDRYNAGQMVDLILLAMQQAGFPAPAGA
ncbi:hypothetical protein HZA57_05790 [Candidatus Poribacteria bacterium]|nr:hypothetical protein [Candidatus Poribacteria bacterium]